MKKGDYDHVAFFMIAIGFIIILPQIYQIYETKSAEDISIYTWVGSLGLSVFWLWYGIGRRVHAVTASSVVHLIVGIVMLNGIIKYGTIF